MKKPHRGAPPGNLNAFIHGFYARRLKKIDLIGIESTNSVGLLEEIALLRIFTRRLLETSLQDLSTFDLSDTLRLLCLASSTITRIIRTQYLLASTSSTLPDDLEEAIRRVNLDLRNKSLLVSIPSVATRSKKSPRRL